MMLFKLIVVPEMMCIKQAKKKKLSYPVSPPYVGVNYISLLYLSSAVIRHAILSLKLDTTYPPFNQQASQH